MSELQLPAEESPVKQPRGREERIARYVQYLSGIVRSRLQDPRERSPEEQLRVLVHQSAEQPHERGWQELSEPSLDNREARTRLFAIFGVTPSYPSGLIIHQYDERLMQFVQPVVFGNGLTMEQRTDFVVSGGRFDAICSELFLVSQQD